jgi:RNA polymerase sigma factor (sigma-70 family)
VQTSALENVLDYLRKQVGAEAIKDLSDTELLERFCGQREEAAFALLLQRHGPTVLGVCRRMLGDVHAAEDAFQTTFLVLVRKAGCVRKRQSLGSFLYGVAYRTAARARVETAERRSRDRSAVVSSYCPDALDELSRAEACAVLHEEMARLPDKYRRPLVLCYLEGKTHEQAAREMAWPKSSVSGRLKRGCELLRQRLSRRGIALSAGALALLVADQSARAVPALLILTTVRLAAQALAGKATAITAAVGTAGGVLKAVIATRMGALLTLSLVVGLAVAGASVLASQHEEPKPAPPPPAARSAEQRKPDPIAAAIRYDEYGDPLPGGALARLGSARLRHAWLHQFLFSADGKTLLSAGGDNLIRRWEIPSGKLVGAQSIALPADDPFGPPDFAFSYVPSLILSPDCKTAACIGPTDLYLLDAATGNVLHRVSCKGKELDRNFLTFTAGGKQVALKTSSGELLLFDVAAGQPIKTGFKDRQFSQSLVSYPASAWTAMDPAGKRIAHWDNHGNVDIWEMPGGKHLLTISIAFCRDMAFSPDGKRFAVVSHKEVIVWNTATGQKEAERPLATNTYYYYLDYSPDGAQLAVSTSGHILLLDAKTLKEVRRLASRECSGVQFSPDGKTLAGRHGSAIHLWNVADGKALDDYPGPDGFWVGRIVYSPDGKSLVCGGYDDATLWDLETKKPRTMLRGSGENALIFSADGQTIFGGEPFKDRRGVFGTIKAWNVADGKEIATFLTADDEKERGSQQITSLQLSPDGKRLTACSWEQRANPIKGKNYLIRWDVLSGKRFAQSSWPAESAMFLSPNGSYLTYSKDKNLILYDLDKKGERVLGRYPPFGADNFSPDGTLLATPSFNPAITANPADEFVSIVETATGKVRFSLPPGTGGVNAFTPDGRYLLTTGLTEFRLWEIATRKEVLRRPVEGLSRGHFGAAFANNVAIAPDGRSAATSLANANILIWDLLPSSRLKGDLSAKDLESLWADLAGDNAAKAYYAGGRLLSAPDKACAFLGKQLRPTTDETERIRSLIAVLNDDEFSKREAANKGLRQFGLLAEQELRRTLDDKPPAETRRVVKDLLDRLETTPTADERRHIRAVWVLEQSGSAEARKTLERLAGGAATARQTREAKAALQRLKAKE